MYITARAIVAALASALISVAFGQEQQSGGEKIDRPFPIIVSRIGDVPFAVPKDWVDSKLVEIPDGRSKVITFANAHLRTPPRYPHFSPPPLKSFLIVEPPPGLALRNMQELEGLISSRWEKRQVDRDGFWNWRASEELLVASEPARPFDQKLVVKCSPSVRPKQKSELACDVIFYWTLATGVRYSFYDTDIPKREWAALDKHVLDLMRFLDGRESWPR